MFSKTGTTQIGCQPEDGTSGVRVPEPGSKPAPFMVELLVFIQADDQFRRDAQSSAREQRMSALPASE